VAAGAAKAVAVKFNPSKVSEPDLRQTILKSDGSERMMISQSTS
jgi:hypothetical protein